MARNKIRPIDFDKAVSKVLQEYGESVNEVLGDAIINVSEQAVAKLKAVAKFAPNRTPTGEYSASWTMTEQRTGRLGKKFVIHNEKHYRLTHLLEKGHVSRNGTGRTFGRVPAYPHIADVNEFVVDELPRQVENGLK
jgi:hypothetical protein